jgi:putative endonuclease
VSPEERGARRTQGAGLAVDEPFDLRGETIESADMGFMYILLCSDSTYYTGSTRDLITRLRQHKTHEGAAYTRRRQPVRLVYYEEFEHVADAFRREKTIQGWTHGKKRMLTRRGTGVRVDDDTFLFGVRVTN